MNRFLPAVAALVLMTGTALAPAFAADLPGPRPSSYDNWPGMTHSIVAGSAANWATPYSTNARHVMAAPSSDEYPGPDLHGQGGS